MKTYSHLGQSLLSGTGRVAIFAAVFLMLLAIAAAADTSSIPHLEKRGNVTQLIVDGKPFLALAGELRNNSATSLEYMKPIWPRLAAMRLNAVLAAITWAQLEPAPGKFFSNYLSA